MADRGGDVHRGSRHLEAAVVVDHEGRHLAAAQFGPAVRGRALQRHGLRRAVAPVDEQLLDRVIRHVDDSAQYQRSGGVMLDEA